MPDLSAEKTHPTPVTGVDEAGRGPWAGPVVAAAAILDPAHIPEGIDDSKALSRTQREALFPTLCEQVTHAVGIASVEEIDQLNILQATKLAMRRAVTGLSVTPAYALIDGNQLPGDLPCPAHAVIKGDRCSLSIAAASVIAKVTRDRLMEELAVCHPAYGWECNAGYGTRQHQQAIVQHGITPYHRRSFAPIRKWLEAEKESA